jgi:hypothetical protein
MFSQNHYCSGKAVNIAHLECAFVEFCIQHAVRFCYLWPVRLRNIFSPYLINGTILEGKLLNIKCVF